MDTNAGSLVAQILVNTNPLEVGLRSAGAMIASFASSMASQLKATASNAFNDTNAAAGLQTTAKALGDLKDAASQFGASGDSVQSALGKMNSSLGKALAGSEGLSEVFDRLGLDIGRLASGDASDAFNQISQAISKIQTQAERTQISQQIFGRIDPSMLRFMKELGTDTEKVLDSMNKYKVSLSNLDSEQLAEVERNFKNLDNVMTGFYENLSAKFAPILNEIADEFLNDGAAGTKAAKLADAAFLTLKETMKGVASLGLTIANSFQYLALQIVKMSQAWVQLKSNYETAGQLAELAVYKEAMMANDPDNVKGGNADEFRYANRAYLKLKAKIENPERFIDEDPTLKNLAIEKDMTEALRKRIEQSIEDTSQTASNIGSKIEEFTNNAIRNQGAKAEWRNLVNQAVRNSAANTTLPSGFGPDMAKEESKRFVDLGFAQSLSGFGGGAAGQDAAMRAMQSSKQQVQVVSDPALKETNETLKVIAKNTEGDGGEVGE